MLWNLCLITIYSLPPHPLLTNKRWLCSTFSRVSTLFLSGVVNGRCWYSSLFSRTFGQLLTGWRCAAEPADLSLRVKPRPMSTPNGGPGVFVWNRERKKRTFQCLALRLLARRAINVTCTSVLGKSCQLRFLRLGGVMSGFCFSSSHWDHTLRWLGFKIVMPKSSETETKLHVIFQFEMSLLV